MPKLSNNDISKEMDKELGKLSREESSFQRYLEKRKNSKDNFLLVGMAVEPYAGKYYLWYENQTHICASNKYKLGIMDIRTGEKYLISLLTRKADGDDIDTTGSMKIENMQQEPEYTHTPLEKTFINGFDINPNTLSYTQEEYYDTNNSTLNDSNHISYYANSDKYEVCNNVFIYKNYDPEQNGGYAVVNEGLFEIRPEMKKQFIKQKQKVYQEVLTYEKEQEDKKKELQKKKDIYRTKSRAKAIGKILNRKPWNKKEII